MKIFISELKNDKTRLFLFLWSMCFFIHETRAWQNYKFSIVAILVVLISLFIRNIKTAWIFSLAPIAVILSYSYPFVANHLLFILIVNIFLIIISFLNLKDQTSWITRSLLFFLCSVYFWAGLHKINTDFFDPSVSCSTEALVDSVKKVIEVNGDNLRQLFWFLPYVVVFLQMSFEPLILIPQFFLLGSTMAMIFHIFLAPLGFVHFGSIPLFLIFFTWLEQKNISNYEKEKMVRFALIYAGFQFIVGLLGGLRFWFPVTKYIFYAQLILWLLASFSLLIFMWRSAVKTKVWRLDNVPRLGWGAILPILALGMGGANYLGLGTVNSFSMFSNVRTEGDFWNHLIIPKSVRIFHYQDKIYYVDEIIKQFAGSINGYPQPAQGFNSLEIYRMYDIWRQQVPLPKKFTLRPQTLNTQSQSAYDVLNPEIKPFSYWEMKLMNFRPVQADGPNKCRW